MTFIVAQPYVLLYAIVVKESAFFLSLLCTISECGQNPPSLLLPSLLSHSLKVENASPFFR